MKRYALILGRYPEPEHLFADFIEKLGFKLLKARDKNNFVYLLG